MHTIVYTVYAILYIVYTILYTVYTILYSVYTILYTMYTILYTEKYLTIKVFISPVFPLLDSVFKCCKLFAGPFLVSILV